jgi:hypothetical protein
MPIPLDVITRKKLILVRQLYQRAVIQAEAKHSYVDRIMALIGFDLTNETILKAVVGAVDPSASPKNDFQGIVRQADDILAAAGLPPVPDKVKIQHVRTLRNDAQHRAKYPNESDVSDCRTYTRDFLIQIVSDVWNEKFESLSLTDLITESKVKGYLVEAETELRNGNYRQAVIKTIAAMDWTFSKIKDSIVGKIPYYTKALVVTETFKDAHESIQVFETFMHMRDILARTVIGLDFQGYLRYARITESVASVVFFEDGGYDVGLNFHEPDANEAEYVVEFAVNAVIQIESLVGDISKPFKV